jgi:hypothetical protein
MRPGSSAHALQISPKVILVACLLACIVWRLLSCGLAWPRAFKTVSDGIVCQVWNQFADAGCGSGAVA